MIHAPSLRLLACLCLLPALACNDPSEGDDLPPGAFTSGPDDGTVDVGDTTTGGSSTSTGESTDESTTAAPEDSGTDDGPLMATHDADIQPIWDANCQDPSCHDSEGPAAGLDLQTPGVRDRLCSNNSAVITNLALVDCEMFDPDESWVYRKVTGDIDLPGAGSLMPVGGMLTSDELALIEVWIEGGALP